MTRNIDIALRRKPFCTESVFISTMRAANLWTSKIEKAYAISTNIHKEDLRNDGVSYLEQHIFPVAIEVHDFLKDTQFTEKALVTAILHDSLEDDPSVITSAFEMQFGKEVVTAIKSLTKPKFSSNRTQERKHAEHGLLLKQLKVAPKWVKVIKCIDRINNLACTEAFRRPKQYRRFLKDTEVYYLPLAEEMDAILYSKMLLEVERLKKELGVGKLV